MNSIIHLESDIAAEKANDSGRGKANSDVAQPGTSDVINLSDFRDRRVPVFWLVELSGAVSFIIWLVVATSISKTPAALPFPSVARTNTPPRFDNLTGDLLASLEAHDDSSSYQASVDVWFALSLTAVLDAFAVVFTFNQAMIREFHYAVSQRMMLLASMLSYAVFLWNSKQPNFVTRHLVTSLIPGVTLYMILSYVLDTFESRWSVNGASLYRGGTLHQYSQGLGRLEASWKRALSLAVTISGVGLGLTTFVPPRWSALVPIVHIFFESVFLSTTKAKKTPRYLTLCSPPFFATVCVHWGLAPLNNGSTIIISPWKFLVPVLVGRLLFDAHLRTTLRGRPGLHCARKEVVMSTRTLLMLSVGMLLLESTGVSIITYMKPIIVLGSFGVANFVLLAIPVYDIAMKISIQDNKR